MIVINLFGAPGSGKSTLSSYLFNKLKHCNIKIELVTEFAKDMVYENNQSAFDNHLYILGNQSYRISRLENKVDVVVTDSPIILAAIYNKDDYIRNELTAVASKFFHKYTNLNYFIGLPDKTNFKYFGRLHNYEESTNLEKKIIMLLNDNGVCFYDFRNYDADKREYIILNNIQNILPKLMLK